MRVVTMMVLCFWVILSVAVGTCADGEPLEPTDISFSFPFDCGKRERGERGPTRTLCLADSFKPGLNVALVNRKGICNARTGSTFAHEVRDDHIIEATHILELQKFSGATIAVVGANPESISLSVPEDGQFSIPKDLESKARRLVAPNGSVSTDPYSVSSSPPRALKVDHLTLLKFYLNDEEGKGPAVLFINNKLIELEGSCAAGHVFFSVNDKLHLAFVEWGCGSGRHIVYVYDLSGTTPKLVYANGDLSV